MKGAVLANRKRTSEDHAATLEAFVLRARRIEAHSMEGDPSRVLAIAHGTMTMTPLESGKIQITEDLPPEEVVESLAARLRPVLLEKDPVHYVKVLKALDSLLRTCGDSQISDGLASLRASWSELVPEGEGLAGYSVQVWSAENPEDAQELTDSKLALGWFYGDVVHATRFRREQTEAFGIKERFRAATHLVFRTHICVVGTLKLIRSAEAKGLLSLDSECWSTEVVVRDSKIVQEADVWSAPVGTPVPPPGSSPGAMRPDALGGTTAQSIVSSRSSPAHFLELPATQS